MIFGLLAVLASSNVHAAAPARVCDYVVSFASACCGPDAQQLGQLANYLKANPELVTADSRGIGDEGETEYCVRVKNHGDLLAVRNHLGRIVSVKSKKPNTPSGRVANCYEKSSPPACRDPKWKSAGNR